MYEAWPTETCIWTWRFVGTEINNSVGDQYGWVTHNCHQDKRLFCLSVEIFPCRGALQCAAVSCSVLQWVAVCYSVCSNKELGVRELRWFECRTTFDVLFCRECCQICLDLLVSYECATVLCCNTGLDLLVSCDAMNAKRHLTCCSVLQGVLQWLDLLVSCDDFLKCCNVLQGALQHMARSVRQLQWFVCRTTVDSRAMRRGMMLCMLHLRE